MNGYEVVLAAEARRAIRELDRAEQEMLAASLQNDLTDQPSVDTVVISHDVPHPLPEDQTYLVHAVGGHIVVYRVMQSSELARLAHEKGWRRAPGRGFIVFDIVPSVPPAL